MSGSDDNGQIDDVIGRGLRLEERAEWEEALALYREAHERFPDDPRLLNRSGVMLIRLDRVEEAREAFNDAATVHREYAPALTNLGNMALEKGNLDDAINLYRRAIASAPDYPGAHHNLGVAYKRQGKMSEYVSETRTAQRLDRTYSRELERLKLRAGGGGRLGSGCLGKTAGILLLVSAGAYLLTRVHA